LEQDLDEDATAGCRVVDIQLDRGHHVPRDRLGADHVPEEARNVSQLIGLVPVDFVVVLVECGGEEILPQTVDSREPLAKPSVEFEIRALLRTAFDDHVGKLVLEAAGNRHFHHLMGALLEIGRRHDREVYRLAQLDKVGIGLVDHLGLLFFFLFLGAFFAGVTP
jgi:hypothetical protein